jgi:2-phospho-L-lactate guanylyltransferase
LTAEELRAFVEATPARGVAVGRAHDGGTNAVAMRPPNVARTHFGEPASAAVHARAAEDAGLEARIVDLPGLAFDVDTPADLERLLTVPGTEKLTVPGTRART